MKLFYVLPEVDVTDINAMGMLCQSGSTIDDLNLLDDDSSNWV